MGRRRHSLTLQLALNGRTVGWLRREPDGATRFRYDAAWLDWRHAIPISRAIPLVEGPHSGTAVQAVFENLLPDGEPLRQRLAERVGADGADYLSLLAAIGRDCVGALQFLPEDSQPEPPAAPDGEPLSLQQVAARVRSLATYPLALDRAENAFRISLAGAQEKTALLYDGGRWLLPRGATPTTHILKPQIGRVPGAEGTVDLSTSVQNEHFCMTLLRELGLPVAESGILALDDDLLVLSVRRFDRQFDRRGRLLRLPQEDCCQALGVAPTRKYEADGGPGISDCMALLLASDRPQEDRAVFMKAQIAFWMVAAVDGHAKNFSLFLRPQGRFSLAPLYDVASLQWQCDRRQIPRRNMRLAMAVGDRRHTRLDEIMPRHFEQSAKRAGLSRAALQVAMQELVEAMPDAEAATAAAMPDCVPQAMMDSILATARRRAGLLAAHLNA